MYGKMKNFYTLTDRGKRQRLTEMRNDILISPNDRGPHPTLEQPDNLMRDKSPVPSNPSLNAIPDEENSNDSMNQGYNLPSNESSNDFGDAE